MIFLERARALRVGGSKNGAGRWGATLQLTSTQSQVWALPHAASGSWPALRAQGRSWYLPELRQCLTLGSAPWLLNSAPDAGKSAGGSSTRRLRSACAQAPPGLPWRVGTAPVAWAPLCSGSALLPGQARGRQHGLRGCQGALHADRPASCALWGSGVSALAGIH